MNTGSINCIFDKEKECEAPGCKNVQTVGEMYYDYSKKYLVCETCHKEQRKINKGESNL